MSVMIVSAAQGKFAVDHQYVVAKYNKAHIGLFVRAEITRPVVNILSQPMHAILPLITWLACP